MRIHEIYGAADLEPDAEHIFVALLLREGFFDKIITTNWDALTEDAHEKFAVGRSRLQVIACPDDLDRLDNGSGVLYKIHGCARKALSNWDRYQPFMVARELDLADWDQTESRRAYREAVCNLLRERPSLLVGISGRDWNLKAAFRAASLARTPYVASPPRVVFSTNGKVAAPHRDIFKLVYGEGYAGPTAKQIDNQAATPLYAKPLLGALFVNAMLEKARLIATSFEPEESWQRELTDAGLELLVSLLCKHYDAFVDPNLRWRSIASDVTSALGRFIGIYRDQDLTYSYEPLLRGNTANLEDDPNYPALDFHWLLFVIGALLTGVQRGLWQMQLIDSDPVGSGHLTINVDGRTLRLWCFQSVKRGLGRAVKNSWIDFSASADVAVLYPTGTVGAFQAAKPGRKLPSRALPKSPAEVCVQELVDSCADVDAFLKRLRQRFSEVAA